MTLYPVSKSIRILNRWVRKRFKHRSWTVSSSEHAQDFTITFFDDVPYSRDYRPDLSATTFRHALHKAARAVEGEK